MVGTIVHVHVLDQTTTKTVFGEHAFHHLDEEGMHTGLDVFVERFLHQNLGVGVTLSAGITGECEVFAVCHLFAGKNHLVGINDDNIVAAFNVGRIAGLVLATQNFGNFRAKATEMLVGGIDEEPLFFHALSVGG